MAIAAIAVALTLGYGFLSSRRDPPEKFCEMRSCAGRIEVDVVPHLGAEGADAVHLELDEDGRLVPDDTGPRVRAADVTLKELAPNGRRCGPVCESRSVALDAGGGVVRP